MPGVPPSEPRRAPENSGPSLPAAPSAVAAEGAKGPELAPVIVDGEVLFQVLGVKNLNARIRANGIVERIQRLAEDPYLSTDSIALSSDEFSTDVVAGDIIIVSVMQPDAAAAGSRTHWATTPTPTASPRRTTCASLRRCARCSSARTATHT